MISQYQAGLSASEILKSVPFKTRKTVYDVLAKHAIPRRRPHGLEDYKSYQEAIFANIDTPAKAYWLGILILRPNTLMPHLLRGILDGDGTVCRRADGEVIIGYCGSERLVVEIRMWLISRLGISDNKVHRNGQISFIQWSHRPDIEKIVRYLYQGAEVCLERKFAFIEEYLRNGTDEN